MKYFAYIGLIVIVLTGCKRRPVQAGAEFDRTSLLTNLADNYALPAQSEFNLKINDLNSSIISFVASPDSAGLQEVRQDWKEALIGWQAVSYLNFGYGATIEQRTVFNVYPTDTNQVNANISSGSYTLGTPANIPAQGLQALEYLIYGTDTTNSIVLDRFVSAPDAANRKTYILDLVSDMKSASIGLINDWNNNRDEFVANSADNSAGSSMSLFVNAYIEHFEAYVRKGKLGLPAGVFNVISGTPMPDHVEAYYSDNSVKNLKESLIRAKQLFAGESFDATENGVGLDDYIQFVEAELEGQPMQVTLSNQFDVAISAVQGLNDPLSDDVVTNQGACTSAYAELQKLVAYLKTDMVSELGIQITYADNDGD